MKCPDCGAWTEVLETRRRPDGSTRRRYECANLHRFTTLETIWQQRCDPIATQPEKSSMRICASAAETLVGAQGLEPWTR